MSSAHSACEASPTGAALSPSAATLTLAALGVVFGDIGTSPLYAVKECFHGLHAVEAIPVNILGVMSLVFWSLIVVVSIKYVMFILRADNHGEGGIFALLALLGGTGRARSSWMVPVAVFGAALLYGDGVITPAISVLSAIEGLNVATDAAAHYVVPLTCAVLFGLFFIQKRGTAAIGAIFGPVMLLWFAVIGYLGLRQIILQPHVLAALNPAYAVSFFAANGFHGMIVLGSVVLCITGGEALYADMGHFGRVPIRLAWHGVALPGLLLNYFGQAALLLAQPQLSPNPFYGLVPQPLLYPMVVLSTMATIIASQAMISGVYSLTQQAMQLGFAPRMRIIHTSARAMGQIYLPTVNWALMIACLGLVMVFKESSNLAAAYGIAVTATMAITSVLYYLVTRRNWGWPQWKSVPLLILFLFFDLAFLAANLLKILDGGWFTLTLALGVMLLMTTWRDGRALLAKRNQDARLPLDVFLKDMRAYKPHRTGGTAVFLSVSPEGVPAPLVHLFQHNGTLPEQVVLLSIVSSETPQVPRCERLTVTNLGQGFHRIVAAYGFMERPNMPEIAELAGFHGLDMTVLSSSFYLGRETLLPTAADKAMARWRKGLFALMSRNSWNVSSYFGIPPSRVIELGTQVEL